MPANKSEVELILTAREQNVVQTLEKTTASVDALIKQLDDIDGAADVSQGSLDALQETLAKLNQAERDLIGKGRLAEKYKAQAAATSQADAKAKQLISTAKQLRAATKAAEDGSPEQSKLAKRFDAASGLRKRSRNWRVFRRLWLRSLAQKRFCACC